jgi:phosphomannomutase
MKLLLFDVDGTLTESGHTLSEEMKKVLVHIQTQQDVHLGIVGGGVFSKIYEQTKDVYFHHIFSECGTVYHRDGQKIYEKNIRHHKTFRKIQELIKCALAFLSTVDYPISGHFIDMRHGFVYISLVGMQATQQERQDFIVHDTRHHIRHTLLQKLRHEIPDESIQVLEGGSVGLSLFPSEWDKVQVMDVLMFMNYDEIHYFGDKHSPDGNDFLLLHHPHVIGHPVTSVQDTKHQLLTFIV